DIEDLINGVKPGDLVYVLDPGTDGLQQIADILAANDLDDLATISIVSHGTTGEVVLGSTTLTDGTLADHSAALAEIGGALGSGGTLQLFGCDIGQGAAGQQFINDVSALAGGVHVGAATHDVGSASLGGSWVLDATAAIGTSAASSAATGDGAVAAASSDGRTTVPTSPPADTSNDGRTVATDASDGVNIRPTAVSASV